MGEISAFWILLIASFQSVRIKIGFLLQRKEMMIASVYLLYKCYGFSNYYKLLGLTD